MEIDFITKTRNFLMRLNIHWGSRSGSPDKLQSGHEPKPELEFEPESESEPQQPRSEAH